MEHLRIKTWFSFEKIATFFLCLFVVFVIFPVKFLIFSSNIYHSGEFIPFISHYLYGADVFFLLGTLFCGFNLLFNNEHHFDLKNLKFDRNLGFLLMVFVLFAGISIFFSVNIENSLYAFFRFLEFFLLYILIILEILPLRWLIATFVGAVLFSSLIGIFQFIFQHSLGLKFLGESVVSNTSTAVAKLNFLGFKLLRSYGTFAHPNIFSAYVLIALIFVYFLNKHEFFVKKSFYFVVLGILFLAFLLTFSKTTLVALLFLPFFLLRKKFTTRLKIFVFCLLAIVVILAFISEITTLERLRFMAISLKLFLNKPFGVGLANFTDEMSQFSFYKLLPWNYQPVHNVFLLALNEIGFAGCITLILIFIYGLYESVKRKETISFALMFVLLIMGLFDHYLFSLYQGQFLFWFIMSVVTCIHLQKPQRS